MNSILKNYPKLGFGTWKMENSQASVELLKQAYDAGYRLFDSAVSYHNEELIGELLTQFSIPREELFLSTKISVHAGTTEAAITEINQSLEKMKTDVIDVVFIHWPAPLKFRDNYIERNQAIYKGLEQMVQAGKIRAIGISNFYQHHIDNLLPYISIKPVLNQIECHPQYVDQALIDYSRAQGIEIQCFSPLGRGETLRHDKIVEMAKEAGVNPAELILAWHLEKGRWAVTNSSNPKHIADNLKAFEIKLKSEWIQTLDSLHQPDGRLVAHPDKAPF